MDSETTVSSPDDLNLILCNAGDMRTITAHPRRHVITYSDTWAPGEKQTYALPVTYSKDKAAMLKIHIGPRPETGIVRVFIGLGDGGTLDKKSLGIRINNESCAKSDDAPPAHMHPIVKSIAGFIVPISVGRNGYNQVEVYSVTGETGKIVWAELYLIP